MKFKKLISLAAIFLLLTLLTGTGAMAKEEKISLTLEEARELALKNNDQVELNRLSIDKAKLKYEQDRFNAKKIDEKYVTSYEMAVGKYVLPLASQVGVVMAEAEVQLKEQMLKLEVESNYYELLKQKAALANAQSALDRAQEQLRIAKESLKAGVIAKSEVIGGEVLVAAKEAAVVKAQNDYDKAVMELAKSVGLELDVKLTTADEFTFKPLAVNLTEELEKVLEKDISVLGAREGLKVAAKTFDLASKYYTPNVFMYREAEYNLEEAKVKLKQSETAAELKVRKAYLDLQSAEKAYHTLEKSLASAKETYRIAKLRFAAGVATRLEVEQAEGSLSEQEASVMEMLYAYNLAAAQFKYGLFR